jgi:hypothetical protein
VGIAHPTTGFSFMTELLSRAIADSVTIYFKLKIIFKLYFKLATITRALNLKD